MSTNPQSIGPMPTVRPASFSKVVLLVARLGHATRRPWATCPCTAQRSDSPLRASCTLHRWHDGSCRFPFSVFTSSVSRDPLPSPTMHSWIGECREIARQALLNSGHSGADLIAIADTCDAPSCTWKSKDLHVWWSVYLDAPGDDFDLIVTVRVGQVMMMRGAFTTKWRARSALNRAVFDEESEDWFEAARICMVADGKVQHGT